MSAILTPDQLADDLEDKLMGNLVPAKASLYVMGDVDPRQEPGWLPDLRPGQYMLQSIDRRLPKMPAKPDIVDFYRLRFHIGGVQHLLQSANLALHRGFPEKVVAACLMHDIAIVGFIRSDHGYWGAQLIEPYVDEEISWAIRYHQALRFFPDPSVGYDYPPEYLTVLGPDFQPDAYIHQAYEYARNHRWYMSSRMICLNDLYAFDPSITIRLEDFEDLLRKYFHSPPEGLGFDNTPSAHMWRTLIMPTRFL